MPPSSVDTKATTPKSNDGQLTKMLKLFKNKEENETNEQLKYLNLKQNLNEILIDLKNIVSIDKNSLNFDELKDLKDGLFIWQAQSVNIFQTQFNQIEKIFEENKKILENIGKAKGNLLQFKNRENHIAYLDYIEKMIHLKLYKDLNLIQILIAVFKNTNEISENLSSLKILNEKRIKEANDYSKIFKKMKEEETQKPSNILRMMREREGESNKKKLNNCAKTIKKNINDFVKDSANIDKCSNSIKANINDFITNINSIKSNKSQSGGTTYDFLTNTINNVDNYVENLKKIKTNFKKGLDDNQKVFNQICEAIKKYLETTYKLMEKYKPPPILTEPLNFEKNIEYIPLLQEQYFQNKANPNDRIKFEKPKQLILK